MGNNPSTAVNSGNRNNNAAKFFKPLIGDEAAAEAAAGGGWNRKKVQHRKSLPATSPLHQGCVPIVRR